MWTNILKLFNKTLFSQEQWGNFSVFWCLININDRRHSFICHKTYFTNPILIHMRFSFITVYINLRLNWQCLWGYSPGRPFWHHCVCNLATKAQQALLANSIWYCSAQEKRLWRARKPSGLKRSANNIFLWRCNNDRLGNGQFCQLHRNVS